MEKSKSVANQIVDYWLAQKGAFASEEDAYDSLKSSISQALDTDSAPTSLVISRDGNATLFKINGFDDDLLLMLAQTIVRDPSGNLKSLLQRALAAAEMFHSIKNSPHQA